MNQLTPLTHHFFVVRIWHEIDHATSVRHWRGTVVRQSPEESHHFSRLQDLMAFIAKQSELDEHL